MLQYKCKMKGKTGTSQNKSKKGHDQREKVGKKMTKREFMEKVIAMGNDELKEFAESEIAKLDARNAHRKEMPSKKSKENEPIKANIIDFLNGKDFTVASEIAKGLELTTQKVSALCRQLVENGILAVTDVKVKGKGTQKGYKVA